MRGCWEKRGKFHCADPHVTYSKQTFRLVRVIVIQLLLELQLDNLFLHNTVFRIMLVQWIYEDYEDLRYHLLQCYVFHCFISNAKINEF